VVYCTSKEWSIAPIDPWSFLQKLCFWSFLAVFRLDLGQISFNLVENAFATRHLAVLATNITFYDILARACPEIKILRFEFFFTFFFVFFFSFCCRDLTFTGLALG